MRSRWSSCWTTCWGESSLLDLVDQVTDWSRDMPILVICMARPDLLDLRSDWGGGKLHATTVALEPLTPQEAERLVENLVRGVDDSALRGSSTPPRATRCSRRRRLRCWSTMG